MYSTPQVRSSHASATCACRRDSRSDRTRFSRPSRTRPSWPLRNRHFALTKAASPPLCSSSRPTTPSSRHSPPSSWLSSSSRQRLRWTLASLSVDRAKHFNRTVPSSFQQLHCTGPRSSEPFRLGSDCTAGVNTIAKAQDKGYGCVLCIAVSQPEGKSACVCWRGCQGALPEGLQTTAMCETSSSKRWCLESAPMPAEL